MILVGKAFCYVFSFRVFVFVFIFCTPSFFVSMFCMFFVRKPFYNPCNLGDLFNV